jgi:hypothetical protein
MTLTLAVVEASVFAGTEYQEPGGDHARLSPIHNSRKNLDRSYNGNPLGSSD